jgi:hypothetical protein
MSSGVASESSNVDGGAAVGGATGAGAGGSEGDKIDEGAAVSAAIAAGKFAVEDEAGDAVAGMSMVAPHFGQRPCCPAISPRTCSAVPQWAH